MRSKLLNHFWTVQNFWTVQKLFWTIFDLANFKCQDIILIFDLANFKCQDKVYLHRPKTYIWIIFWTIFEPFLNHFWTIFEPFKTFEPFLNRSKLLNCSKLLNLWTVFDLANFKCQDIILILILLTSNVKIKYT